MKKHIIAALMLVSAATSADAQFRFGPEVGVNIGSISRELSGTLSTFSVSNSTRVGLRAGAIADVPLTKNLYFQPGVFYSNRSTVSTVSVFIASIDQTLSLNYLEVPLNIQYKTGNPGEARFFAGVGPYVGYVIGGYTKTELDASLQQLIGGAGALVPGLSDDKQKISTGSDSTDQVKPFDFGANLNIGYELPMGLVFRAQGGLGLLNTSPLSDVGTQKNWAINITVAYLLNPKKAAKKAD